MSNLERPSSHGLLAQIAQWRTPKPALIQGDRSVTYEELHKATNQVAHYLRSTGAGAESRIGISMERSIDFVVAALGVLKCGAAYVPLDPSYPVRRRTHIIADAGLQQILCSTSSSTPAAGPAPTVALDSAEILAQPTADLIDVHINPAQLAYVIYTSGSTGAPKGIEVSYGNLLHLVEWHNHAFQVTPADRATLMANVGFDASVWELWPYLCSGGSVLIPSPDMIRDPESLKDWLLGMGVTIFFAPTLLAEVLISTPWPGKGGPRYLLTGGELLRVPPLPGLPFRVINNYGPAECTVVSTSGEVESSSSSHKTPSIGYPVAGAHILVLDDDLREVPTGTPGEICIAGNGVARGYLNQPELTAEKFILYGEDGQKLYRSGDLGRYNVDGSIQFLGRLDEQVKIRGYRIECGEIEAALNGLPLIQSSAVVLREQRGGHKGLTAYVVPEAEATLSRGQLREQLRTLIPEYMIPEQFVRVYHIPTNDNGKLDRRMLSSLTEQTIIESTDQPSTRVETELMVIMAKLLKIDQVDRSDDFFLLGGHSFVAAQLIARIRDHFGVELSLRTVFEHPTVPRMALQIEQRVIAQL